MQLNAFNPYLPSYEYIPDSEPRIFDDRLYVYGSHDKFDGADFCLGDYVLWSAPLSDLSDWHCDGVIYRKNQDPKNSDGKMHMCAPDCIQGPDGRFYLYYQLHALKCTSVAVADNPTGPFSFYGYVQHPDGTPWGMKKGDTFAFDPGVLVDDSGKIYLYIGFSPKGLFKTVFKMRGNRVDGAVCLELEQDMKTVKGLERPVIPGPSLAKGTSFEGHAFFEASSPRKIGDTYYLVYSSELSHELCYATSKKPDGDFAYGGTIISIGDIGYKGNQTPKNYTGNTHGGIVNIKNQWYVFYHRQTNKQKCARQGCAEKIELLADGSIPQVEMTSCGLNNGPLPGKGKYKAHIACNLKSSVGTFPYLKVNEKDKTSKHPYFTQSGIDREENGDQYIANMTDGAEAVFKYFSFSGTETMLTIEVRGSGNGVMELYLGENPLPLTVISVSSSETFVSFTASVPFSAGVKSLTMRYSGAKSIDFQSFEIE